MSWIKKKIMNWLLGHLFNAVTEDEVLRSDKEGKLMVGENILSPGARKSLKQQAIALSEDHTLFEFLLKDMKYAANKRMYERGQNVDDLIFGKAMLYAVDVLERKVDKLSKLHIEE